jgi:hypothetical protein
LRGWALWKFGLVQIKVAFTLYSIGDEQHKNDHQGKEQ